MKSGQCENCGADYGPNDMVCSYCGSPIHRKQEGYGGFEQQSYQSMNGGTQVIQNIYVNSNGSGSTNIGDALSGLARQVEQNASSSGRGRSSADRSYSSPYSLARSRILAGILSIVFGWIGIQFFYLNKIGLGIVCLIFSSTGIPALIGVIQGIMILKMSDAEFEEKYHVRAM